MRIALGKALALGAWSLLATLAQAGEKKDLLPASYGFEGSFSHRSGDQFEWDFNGGVSMVLSRQGTLTSFHAGAASVTRDKAGKPLKVSDAQGLLCTLSYDPQGRLVIIRARQSGNIKVAYSRSNGLYSVRFPNGQRGYFPVSGSK